LTSVTFSSLSLADYLFAGLIDISVNIDELCDPNFEFQYGFNPIRFIADYLKWWHPSSAEQRIQDRELASQNLVKRALAAKIDCGLAQERTLKLLNAESGIEYGPVTTPLSESSVLVIARAVIPGGHIAFELSTSVDFSDILQRSDKSVGLLRQAKTTFENLIPSTQYFVRCSLFSEGELERQREVAVKLQAAAEAEVCNSLHGPYISDHF